MSRRFPAALRFGGASTDKVSCGTNSILDNPSVWTVATLLYQTDNVTGKRICQKGLGSNSALFSADATQYAIDIARASSACTAIANHSAFTAFGLNRWLVVAAQSDISTAANNRLFVGNEILGLAEPSSYALQTAGSGAQGNNAGAAAIIGNKSNDNTPFIGRLAWLGVWRRLLGVGELLAVQAGLFEWPGAPSDLPWGNVGDWSIGASGPSVVLDASPYRQLGTVTGTARIDGPPSGPMEIAA